MTAAPASHTYISQRLRLHYADWGNPQAPPLIVLHGGRDHCRNWDWVAQTLRRDWRVIAPDLRGHGDSQHAPAGGYTMAAYVYDLAQLIHQQGLAPVTLVAHSLGGNIALRYAGLYPEHVRKLAAIEGLGPSPAMLAERAKQPVHERFIGWIEEQRTLAARAPRRYPSHEAAFARMRAENPRLSPEQARHLTIHGVIQNEDGTYSWKFDNYVRSMPPGDLSPEALQTLWGRIRCPTLLVYGCESWASNPARDGRLEHFQDARVLSVEGAGHWVHHDRLDVFLAELTAFLAEPAGAHG